MTIFEIVNAYRNGEKLTKKQIQILVGYARGAKTQAENTKTLITPTLVSLVENGEMAKHFPHPDGKENQFTVCGASENFKSWITYKAAYNSASYDAKKVTEFILTHGGNPDDFKNQRTNSATVQVNPAKKEK